MPSDVEDRVDRLESLVEDLQDELEDEREARREAEKENDQLRERVDDLEEELEDRAAVRWDSSDGEEIQVESTDGSVYPIGRVVASKASRYEVEDDLEELEERLAEGDLAADVQEAEADAGPDVEAETPLEQVAILPQQVADTELSPNQLRARFLAQELRSFGDKSTSGYVLRAGRVGRLLKSGMDVEAHPETVRRVMDHFDRFGDDGTRLRKRGGEKVLWVDDEVVDRLERLLAAPHTPVSRGEA